MKFIIILLLVYNVSFAQVKSKAKATIYCIDSILTIIPKNNTYQAIKIDIKRKPEIIINNQKRKLNQLGIKEWLQYIDKDSINAYRLSAENEEYYLLSSNIKQATGKAANLRSWLIINNKSDKTITFESLANEKALIYYDSVTSSLVYYQILYNEFFNNKSYSYNIYKNKGNVNGSVEILKSWVSFCVK